MSGGPYRRSSKPHRRDPWTEFAERDRLALCEYLRSIGEMLIAAVVFTMAVAAAVSFVAQARAAADEGVTSETVDRIAGTVVHEAGWRPGRDLDAIVAVVRGKRDRARRVSGRPRTLLWAARQLAPRATGRRPHNRASRAFYARLAASGRKPAGWELTRLPWTRPVRRCATESGAARSCRDAWLEIRERVRRAILAEAQPCDRPPHAWGTMAHPVDRANIESDRTEIVRCGETQNVFLRFTPPAKLRRLRSRGWRGVRVVP